MILRFCSTVVFIVIMRHVMPALQWFNQHSKYVRFQMVYQLRNKMMVVNLNKYTGY